jgi:DNA ligase-1
MKYDGFRMQVHKKGERVEVYSRKLETMTPMFPDVVAAVKKLPKKDLIFEGEALAYDTEKKKYYPFQQTMHRRRKHGIAAASKEFPLNLFVFDILYIEGKDMTNEPYRERRAVIEKLFRGGILQPSQSVVVEKTEELRRRFKLSLSEGLEGIMAKDLDAPYTAGKRKFAWIKLKKSYGKAVDTVDAVIVGYYLGRGARAEFEFGGVLLAVYNPDNGKLETIAKMATGFTEEEMKGMKETLEKTKTEGPAANLDCKIEVDFWVEPKYVVEVAFDEITQSPNHTCGISEGKGYALRFPRLVKMRPDKSVKEITTTAEVVEMFGLQHAR